MVYDMNKRGGEKPSHQLLREKPMAYKAEIYIKGPNGLINPSYKLFQDIESYHAWNWSKPHFQYVTRCWTVKENGEEIS